MAELIKHSFFYVSLTDYDTYLPILLRSPKPLNILEFKAKCAGSINEAAKELLDRAKHRDYGIHGDDIHLMTVELLKADGWEEHRPPEYEIRDASCEHGRDFGEEG